MDLLLRSADIQISWTRRYPVSRHSCKVMYFSRTVFSANTLTRCRGHRLDKLYTVDRVIFACLNFSKCLILGLFTEFKIREFTFFFSIALLEK